MVVIGILLTFWLINKARLQLYDGCGDQDVACVGSRDNVPSIHTGGCIERKDCQVFVKVEKKDVLFSWQLAFGNSRKIDVPDARLMLAVTKEKVSLQNGEMPLNIPYYYYIKVPILVPIYSPVVLVCRPTRKNDPNCMKGEQKVNPKHFIDFVPLNTHNFPDSKLTYTTSKSKSGETLMVNESFTENDSAYNVTFTVNLITDNLTISLFHWDYETNSDVMTPSNSVTNMDPQLLFARKAGRSKKKLIWLWIPLAIVGLVIIIIIVILICYRRNLEQPHSQSAANERSLLDIPKGEADGKQPGKKQKKGNRLDYIANLAGYDPNQPIRGQKTTPTKKHTSKDSFQSTKIARKQASKPKILFMK